MDHYKSDQKDKDFNIYESSSDKLDCEQNINEKV